MFNWAWKTLFSQKGSLIGSALGIASAFILVMFFESVWRGETEQIIAYPNHVKPDVWVMQNGVGNMHMAMSFVWDWKADRIASMPEVQQVTPILYMANVVNAGDQKLFAFIVGLLPNATRAGPWEMSAGREVQNPGEVVIPDVLVNITGVGIGENIQIADKTFTVVGLSKGTFSSANAVMFVPFDDLQDILSSTGTYSYLLVDAEEGIDPNQLAKKIRDNVEKVNALPHEEFIENDYALAEQMGVEMIMMMTSICSALAVLIVGFSTYSMVTRKRRELAIAKALGITNTTVFLGVMTQAILLTLLGFLIATAFVLTVVPQLPTLVPQLTVSISMLSIAQMGAIALLIAVGGALIPTFLLLRLDPATAFHV